MQKKPFKTLLSWCFALIIAVLCANLITFFYRSSSGSIPRENACSDNIRMPNSTIIRGAEGYGINAVDENGYVNSGDLPLADGYILLMGSSHAEGLQVMQRDNMATVLSNLIDENTRSVYNLGTPGYSLPLIIKGFQAGIEEFPGSSAVVIEFFQMHFGADDLQAALDQPHFDSASSGKALAASMSTLWHARNSTLSMLPIISLLRQQFDSIHWNFNDAFGIQPSPSGSAAASAAPANEDGEGLSAEPVASEPVDIAEYDEALNQAFALLRREYGNPIILVYHPYVTIQSDGSITIDRDERYYDLYVRACENNGLVFLDTGDAFLSAYQADYTLPYGFNNTVFGAGHLNVAGHRILAQEIYQSLLKLQNGEIS